MLVRAPIFSAFLVALLLSVLLVGFLTAVFVLAVLLLLAAADFLAAVFVLAVLLLLAAADFLVAVFAAVLAAVFTQLGDSLATILANKDLLDKKWP